MVLNLISNFYAKQLEARQRFKNKLEFTYDFSIDTITLFLDALHGVRLVSIRLFDILSLLKERWSLFKNRYYLNFNHSPESKFLRYEGKSDESKFEKRLVQVLCKKLIAAELSIEVKLLVCVICDTFDNFNGRFERVSWIHFEW